MRYYEKQWFISMYGKGDVMGRIERLIHELGINSTYYGYRFLHYAILLAVRDSSYLLVADFMSCHQTALMSCL